MGQFMIKIMYIFACTLTISNAVEVTITNDETESIEDKECFEKQFDMTQSLRLLDVNVSINIDHTWRADLDITLKSPKGTSVDLTSDNGSNSDNLYVHFDDSASKSIKDDRDSHSEMVVRSPEKELSAFNGEDAYGVWTLEICDDANADQGTYHEASLEMNGTIILLSESILSEYREDECYWLGSSNVDIIDRINQYNAEAMSDANTRSVAQTDAYHGLCRAGDFSQGHYIDIDNRFTLEDEWTMSTWVEFPLTKDDQTWHILGSYVDKGDLPLISYVDYPDIKWGVYDNDGDTTLVDFNDSLEGWHQLLFVTTSGNTELYLDGVYHSSVDASTSGEVSVLYTSKDGHTSQNIASSADEFKLWKRVINRKQIKQIYDNEKAGKNYDGSPRECKTCEANATAGVWGLIGLPADLRSAENRDVADMFDEFPESSYADSGAEDGWIVFKREYSESNNSSKYSVVSYEDDPLEFGQGYWLLSKEDVSWSENGIINVDYNSTNENCPTSPCVEIPLTSVSLNFAEPDNDENDHTGKNRNNMLGFVGHTPVNWADCRIVVDDTSYTPSEAEDEGYVKKEIWQYNPDADDASSNGYVTCNDVTPGGCKLEPYKGFWLILQGKSKNKNMKLLLPKE